MAPPGKWANISFSLRKYGIYQCVDSIHVCTHLICSTICHTSCIYDFDVCPLIVITICQVQWNGPSGHGVCATALIWASKLSLPQTFSTWLCSRLLLHFLDRITCTFTLSWPWPCSETTHTTSTFLFLYIFKRVKERHAHSAPHNQIYVHKIT